MQQPIDCAICKEKIKTKECLMCTICKKHYHVTCTSNIGEKFFRCMTSKSKDIWRCQFCVKQSICSKQKNKTSNISKNSPVIPLTTSTPTNKQKTPTISKKTDEREEPHSTPSPTSCDNVTQNFTVNVHTENSFQSLSYEYDQLDSNQPDSEPITSDKTHNTPSTSPSNDINYVTKRQPRIARSLSNLEQITSKSLIYSTHNSFCSLPEMNNQINQLQMRELLQELESVKSNLLSAEAEIVNLIQENQQLKKEMQVLNKKVDKYKYMFVETLSSPKEKVRNTPLLGKSVNNGQIFTSTSPLKSSNISPSTQEAEVNVKAPRSTEDTNIIALNSNENSSSQDIMQSSYEIKHYNKCIQSNNLIKTNVKSDKKSKHKVLILADENGKTIGKRMQKLLGSEFTVQSILKPGALIDQVLNSLNSLCRDFTFQDFVVIMCGSNESNPTHFQSYLYYHLNEISHTNVLVGSVYENKHLNVTILNKNMRQITSNFGHASYIDIHNFDGINYKLYKQHSCQLMLREMLRRVYKENYDNYMKQGYLNNCKATQTEMNDDTEIKEPNCIIDTCSIKNIRSCEKESPFFREEK